MASAHQASPDDSPARSAIKSRAAPALLVSFHSRAGRITSPRSSSTTKPCCWPPTLSARTSSSPPDAATASFNASHQARGSTSVPSGCGARPSRTTSPDTGSHTTTLHDCVDESTPATKGLSPITQPLVEETISRSGDASPAGAAPRSGTRARRRPARRTPRRSCDPPGSPQGTRPRPAWIRPAREPTTSTFCPER